MRASVNHLQFLNSTSSVRKSRKMFVNPNSRIIPAKMGVLIVLLASFCVLVCSGCRSYNNTIYSEYRGSSVFEGHGGSVRTVGGIEIWETGTPNRKYKLLGIVQHSHYDNHSLMAMLASVSKDSEVIRQVKIHGGDAIIVLDKTETLRGFTSSSQVSGQERGTISTYGNSGTYNSSVSATVNSDTLPITEERSVLAVIAYWD